MKITITTIIIFFITNNKQMDNQDPPNNIVLAFYDFDTKERQPIIMETIIEQQPLVVLLLCWKDLQFVMDTYDTLFNNYFVVYGRANMKFIIRKCKLTNGGCIIDAGLTRGLTFCSYYKSTAHEFDIYCENNNLKLNKNIFFNTNCSASFGACFEITLSDIKKITPKLTIFARGNEPTEELQQACKITRLHTEILTISAQEKDECHIYLLEERKHLVKRAILKSDKI